MNLTRVFVTHGTKEFFFKRSEKDFLFLVFFRISIGIFSILHFSSTILDFQRLFGKNGIIPSDIQTLLGVSADYIVTLPQIVGFFENYGISENNVLTFIILIFFLASAFLVLGLFTRCSAFLLLILQLAIINGAGLYKYGVDNFMTSSLFYLTIFPSGHFYSIDNLIFKNRKNEKTVTPFKRLFQIHLCLVYFFSGFGKSLGFNWWNGEAIWKSIHLPMSNKYFNFDFSWLAENSFILILLGWSIIIIETLYPIFIWIPRTKKIWLVLTISMHLGIAVILNLYFFATLMIIWNLTAFYFNSVNDSYRMVTNTTTT